MAITSYDYAFDKNAPKSSCLKSSNINPISSTKISSTTNSSLASSNRYNKSKIDKYISPYLPDDRIQLLSRVTEKKFLHKNHDFMSSFPLAVNIYKANSDDLRSSKRNSRKVKKSVLTLPNEPTPLPQTCTVSDMNDSEYFNEDENVIKPKPKKRRAVQTRRKSRINDQIDLYNTKTKHYSQLDNLHKSSKDMLNFTGSDVRKSKRSNNNSNVKSNVNAHDVWTLLRNVNHFKFIPSPPVSQESSMISVKKVKKRKNNKQRNNRKDTRFIETCRTEEFAYISSFVESSRNSCSQSSFDRITVIEKQDEFEKITCNELETRVDKPTTPYKYHESMKSIQNIDRSMKSKSKQNHIRVHSVTSNNKNLNSKKLLPQGQSIPHQNINKKHNNNKTIYLNNFETIQDNLIEKNPNDDNNMNQNKINELDIRSNVSEKSDSSKEGIKKRKSKIISSKNLLEKLTPNESQQHVAGITKVVLSKGQNILLTKQIAALQRKPRVTTPVNSENPKVSLTLSEIKRKLRSIKFPLVILGKDQLSSEITVENYDPPQFAGLDEHIWPFMRLWCGESYHNLFDNINNTANYNLNCNLSDKTSSSPFDDKEKPITQIKPMRRIKNRMMQFMHKKSFIGTEVNYRQKQVNKVDIGVNTVNNMSSLKQEYTILKKDKKMPNKYSSNISYAKTKGKWASDFIENVIRKIKTGIYYSQDDKEENKELFNNMKEDGVQTDIESIETNPDFDNSVKNNFSNEIDSVVSIPGFDNRFSDLEIETLNNFNRVTVKHCVANIIVHFDVALSFENNRVLQIKQSYPCVQVSLNENQPTIFKCKTTIINAILPAELCSILPNIMKKIIRSNSKLALSTSAVDKNSNLSTITEITRCDSDSNKYSISVHNNPNLRINILSEGNFTPPYINKTIERKNIELKSSQLFNLANMKELLNGVNIKLLPLSDIRLINYLSYNNKPMQKLPLVDVTQNTERFRCKIVQPYLFSAKKILPLHENYSFMRIVENILSYQRLNMNASLSFNFEVALYKNSFNVNFVIPDIILPNFAIPKVKVDNLHNDLADNLVDVHKVSLTSNLNTYYAPKVTTKPLRTSKSDKHKSTVEFCVNNARTKKRGFVKLYKKCKSMSSILTHRSSMNLDKITNLEEFYLALGSGKMLSGVLDGNVGRKILSSIKEMKNWMSDITPRQALLVLLLANKKDTTNLVRYRPLILQGIAVNRITRASELDMEIEVIERENLNKWPQYEGITYLPASEENQDTLLEELCWIAKTTASDYQKHFDESSERLLKSLLEKRKKLNPSYLRVMARYVGLGLLKSSK
ncbi:unnamed protein product [Euphydryas editha]|uniref:Uncharacterized protein n=1 Tax=Euphydryas editha TaxID=104508 RepID=A0AAU9TPL1_EUPED|nr:unnamed protein product [Euphydryas editha]